MMVCEDCSREMPPVVGVNSVCVCECGSVYERVEDEWLLTPLHAGKGCGNPAFVEDEDGQVVWERVRG